MSHDAAFLQDIREHPYDDAPRLIYADWLDEHGDRRATFIRVQVELARLPLSDRHQRHRLERREASLLRRYEPIWLEGLRRPGLAPSFWRGFLEGAWPNHTTFWLALDAFLDRLGGWMAAALLPDLGVCNHVPISGDQLERLANSPFLRLINHVRLDGTGVSTQGIKALAASPNAIRLRSLQLNGNLFGAPAVATLTGSRALRSLTSLDLGDNQLGNLGAEALARSDAWTGLTSLDLSQNRIGDVGIRALAASRYLTGLTELNLRANPFGEDGARALAGSPYLGRVKTLRLHVTGLGGRARSILAARFGPNVSF